MGRGRDGHWLRPPEPPEQLSKLSHPGLKGRWGSRAGKGPSAGSCHCGGKPSCVHRKERCMGPFIWHPDLMPPARPWAGSCCHPQRCPSTCFSPTPSPLWRSLGAGVEEGRNGNRKVGQAGSRPSTGTGGERWADTKLHLDF